MTTLDYIRDVWIYQNKDGYRFSVDSLLLYSFINLRRASSIVDLGSGSGIIGLLLAKKYTHSKVFLVEIQEGLASLSERNIKLNSLQDRVFVIRSDIKKLSEELREKYVIQSQSEKVLNTLLKPESLDLVVSNPPFRKIRCGLLSNADEKAIARHELLISLNHIIESAYWLLKHHGRFCMIHLPERLIEIIETLKARNLEPKRVRFAHSTVSSEAKMVLVEAVKGGKPGIKIEKPLIIYNEDKSYTDEMKKLYMLEYW
jgi:tRNA1Val (adenine37-N6)-methyltransferase